MKAITTLVLVVAANVVLVGQTPATTGPLTTYTDASRGVRFQYPSVWKPLDDPSSAASLVTENSSITPVFAVGFSPEGNVYDKTNLTGLTFVYFATPATSAAACAKMGDVSDANSAAKPTDVTIHGVRFQHSTGGDGGMSQWRASDVYSVYRDKTCFIFEEIFGTVNASVAEKHELTATQSRALQRHLDAITRSIVFTAKP